eukprot:CAMPEP_0174722654 /NCGR_PEP_ID=MMETSP1094-20130205/38948_1 /TAXON_ID=156173 /ORGANISM="Chrysochromulina brevifilum, Strain UTEX LB 985" /LENGTH=48 /DNA_ID= /DNA_START= /DNA_END= /DNA_ORIENTATION=
MGSASASSQVYHDVANATTPGAAADASMLRRASRRPTPLIVPPKSAAL